MTPTLRAGAVVFRIDDGFVRVLLVRSSRDPSLWVFPKGHIEPGESAEVASLREAFEEAGVAGLIVGRAGARLTFRSGDEDVAVDYFLVERTAEMASPEGREKCWCLPDEADRRLVFRNTRELLREAVAMIRCVTRTQSGVS